MINIKNEITNNNLFLNKTIEKIKEVPGSYNNVFKNIINSNNIFKDKETYEKFFLDFFLNDKLIDFHIEFIKNNNTEDVILFYSNIIDNDKNEFKNNINFQKIYSEVKNKINNKNFKISNIIKDEVNNFIVFFNIDYKELNDISKNTEIFLSTEEDLFEEKLFSNLKFKKDILLLSKKYKDFLISNKEIDLQKHLTFLNNLFKTIKNIYKTDIEINNFIYNNFTSYKSSLFDLKNNKINFNVFYTFLPENNKIKEDILEMNYKAELLEMLKDDKYKKITSKYTSNEKDLTLLISSKYFNVKILKDINFDKQLLIEIIDKNIKYSKKDEYLKTNILSILDNYKILFDKKEEKEKVVEIVKNELEYFNIEKYKNINVIKEKNIKENNSNIKNIIYSFKYFNEKNNIIEETFRYNEKKVENIKSICEDFLKNNNIPFKDTEDALFKIFNNISDNYFKMFVFEILFNEYNNIELIFDNLDLYKRYVSYRKFNNLFKFYFDKLNKEQTIKLIKSGVIEDFELMEELLENIVGDINVKKDKNLFLSKLIIEELEKDKNIVNERWFRNYIEILDLNISKRNIDIDVIIDNNKEINIPLTDIIKMFYIDDKPNIEEYFSNKIKNGNTYIDIYNLLNDFSIIITAYRKYDSIEIIKKIFNSLNKIDKKIKKDILKNKEFVIKLIKKQDKEVLKKYLEDFLIKVEDKHLNLEDFLNSIEKDNKNLKKFKNLKINYKDEYRNDDIIKILKTYIKIKNNNKDDYYILPEIEEIFKNILTTVVEKINKNTLQRNLIYYFLLNSENQTINKIFKHKIFNELKDNNIDYIKELYVFFNKYYFTPKYKMNKILDKLEINIEILSEKEYKEKYKDGLIPLDDDVDNSKIKCITNKYGELLDVFSFEVFDEENKIETYQKSFSYQDIEKNDVIIPEVYYNKNLEYFRNKVNNSKTFYSKKTDISTYKDYKDLTPGEIPQKKNIRKLQKKYGILTDEDFITIKQTPKKNYFDDYDSIEKILNYNDFIVFDDNVLNELVENYKKNIYLLNLFYHKKDDYNKNEIEYVSNKMKNDEYFYKNIVEVFEDISSLNYTKEVLFDIFELYPFKEEDKKKISIKLFENFLVVDEDDFYMESLNLTEKAIKQLETLVKENKKINLLVKEYIGIEETSTQLKVKEEETIYDLIVKKIKEKQHKFKSFNYITKFSNEISKEFENTIIGDIGKKNINYINTKEEEIKKINQLLDNHYESFYNLKDNLDNIKSEIMLIIQNIYNENKEEYNYQKIILKQFDGNNFEKVIKILLNFKNIEDSNLNSLIEMYKETSNTLNENNIFIKQNNSKFKKAKTDLINLKNSFIKTSNIKALIFNEDLKIDNILIESLYKKAGIKQEDYLEENNYLIDLNKVKDNIKIVEQLIKKSNELNKNKNNKKEKLIHLNEVFSFVLKLDLTLEERTYLKKSILFGEDIKEEIIEKYFEDEIYINFNKQDYYKNKLQTNNYLKKIKTFWKDEDIVDLTKDFKEQAIIFELHYTTEEYKQLIDLFNKYSIDISFFHNYDISNLVKLNFKDLKLYLEKIFKSKDFNNKMKEQFNKEINMYFNEVEKVLEIEDWNNLDYNKIISYLYTIEYKLDNETMSKAYISGVLANEGKIEGSTLSKKDAVSLNELNVSIKELQEKEKEKQIEYKIPEFKTLTEVEDKLVLTEYLTPSDERIYVHASSIPCCMWVNNVAGGWFNTMLEKPNKLGLYLYTEFKNLNITDKKILSELIQKHNKNVLNNDVDYELKEKIKTFAIEKGIMTAASGSYNIENQYTFDNVETIQKSFDNNGVRVNKISDSKIVNGLDNFSELMILKSNIDIINKAIELKNNSEDVEKELKKYANNKILFTTLGLGYSDIKTRKIKINNYNINVKELNECYTDAYNSNGVNMVKIKSDDFFHIEENGFEEWFKQKNYHNLSIEELKKELAKFEKELTNLINKTTIKIPNKKNNTTSNNI